MSSVGCQVGIGSDYMGYKSQTQTGLECQEWWRGTPQPHSGDTRDLANFPDVTLKDAVNYCRNPTNDTGGVWCFTMDTMVRKGYCDVPDCSQGHGTYT